MLEHAVGTREEWLAARKRLLEREKELTRRNDELARERQALPWVPVEKEYTFETNEGTKTLAELFDGRSQLLVYHLAPGTATRPHAISSRQTVIFVAGCRCSTTPPRRIPVAAPMWG